MVKRNISFYKTKEENYYKSKNFARKKKVHVMNFLDKGNVNITDFRE